MAYGDQLELSAPRVFLDFGEHRLMPWFGFDVFPDGESVLAVRQVPVTDEKRENAMPDGVRVVQNWLAEF